MTHKQQILEALWSGQWINFRMLNNICFRYSARIYELKEDKIFIENKTVNKIVYYKLITPTSRIDRRTCKLKPIPIGENQEIGL